MLQAMREGLGRSVAIVIMGLLAVAFVFFGIDFSMTGTTFAAKVNGEDIPILEFEREVQNQQSQYQQLYRIELNDDLRREIRANVVERMVRNLALEQRAADSAYRASDQRVQAAIQSTPAFQAGGEFFLDLYRSRLTTEGLTPATYEEQERLRLELTDLQAGIVESTFLTPAEFRRYIQLSNQRRQVAYATFAVESFAEGIELTDEQIQAHYDENGERYLTEETVDLEYIELAQADVAAAVSVTEEDVRAYYEEEQALFEREEVRNARHILVSIGDDGVEAAIARAEEILQRINDGEDFEQLAAEVSDDAGTSSQGGNLGPITRGMLPGAFEDALYSMEVGEVRGPVESDFGVHIIRLDSISEGDVQSFESVRDDLTEQLRNREAEDRFFELANTMDERAYEGVDLATLAADLELALISLTGFPRTGNSDVFENSAAVVQAAFSDDVLLGGLNSGAVQLADDHVLVLRVVAHNEPEQRPLEDVREEIATELRFVAAEQRAIEAADAFRAEAETAEDLTALAESLGGTWTEETWIERADATLPVELVARIFGLGRPAAGSAVWDSVALSTGDQTVLVLRAVESGEPETIAREERDERQEQLAQQAGLVELAGYIGEVRSQATVRIPEEVLDPIF